MGNNSVMVCERGTMFGYSDLVVDPRNLVFMRDAKCPIVRARGEGKGVGIAARALGRAGSRADLGKRAPRACVSVCVWRL